jgi:peptidoglycan/LPS O-acetylase OafA/YrhL
MLAVWVFIYHATYFSGGSVDHMPPGAVAVDLFMLVSGFLMSSNYHARAEIEPWDAPSTWLTFYTRRFFRIAPLYYVALAFAMLFGNQYSILTDITVKAYPPPWASSLPLDPVHRHPSLVNALLHVSFLFGFLPTFASNNVLPDWSLELEMQFCAVFRFLMLFMRRLGFLPTAALSMALFVGSKLL